MIYEQNTYSQDFMNIDVMLHYNHLFKINIFFDLIAFNNWMQINHK